MELTCVLARVHLGVRTTVVLAIRLGSGVVANRRGQVAGVGQAWSGDDPGALRIAGSARWSHAARFENGEWQLQLMGALAPTDTAAAPAFRPGQPVPIAFFAADGSNGEEGVRGSVSAWYSIYLEVPTPSRVYVQPVLVGLLTAGLGLFAIHRAQRREPPPRAGGSTAEG